MSVYSVIGKEPLLPPHPESGRYVLVVHGGAGILSRKGSTPEQQALYRTALRSALQAGYDVLSAGGEAMDAAVAAVAVMEGQPLRYVPIFMPHHHSQFRLPAVQCRERCRIQCGWKSMYVTGAYLCVVHIDYVLRTN